MQGRIKRRHKETESNYISSIFNAINGQITIKAELSEGYLQFQAAEYKNWPVHKKIVK